jgi:hypothetical protein
MFALPFKGQDLDPNGEVIIDIFYDSRNLRKTFNVEITNIPWYGKIKMSLAKLFRVF